ncbi:hypothetical protein CROQUDRAFT_575556 [Cronartium quercuum f. sp. fusiforme G11]|uniref:Eukaryotic translation initiation factor 3 subunit G n=1 Tax=Cronartium quercuum f. sp. fusiforme G11 TaxID=708437 RepID=A0A9P6NJN8_9BASI|nr:hypothetical protein CROQUDRAFT_575556 [Cronartium quercuum f. sp. fusiforme G11]
MANLAPPQLSAPAAKTSWADELDEDELPPISETIDQSTGIKTIIEIKFNEAGKKIKTIRKIKRTLITTQVSHSVAIRKQWSKFGAELGKKSGPDSSTTTLGEAVKIKLIAGGIKEQIVEPTKVTNNTGVSRRITCRLCQGDHFTASCPYKETLGNVLGGDTAAEEIQDAPAVNQSSGGGTGGGASGKYVPPSQRLDANKRGAGDSMQQKSNNRDDLPTLRVTNLSEDVQESDLWDLFARFGRISRIYVGKDQETGLCKGFAFVSFEDRNEAEKAMKKINGLPYDHLILGCMWSLPRGERESK